MKELLIVVLTLLSVSSSADTIPDLSKYPSLKTGYFGATMNGLADCGLNNLKTSSSCP